MPERAHIPVVPRPAERGIADAPPAEPGPDEPALLERGHVEQGPGSDPVGSAASSDPVAERALEARARRYQALGEPRRLRIAEALRLTDLTPSDLAATTGLGSNLLAFHLKVLEEAGIVHRTVSEGDRRRRYVQLVPEASQLLGPAPTLVARRPVFVCTRNSARSPMAAALWQRLTGTPARSAGADPADRVHRLARIAAQERGLDLSEVRPRGYGEVEVDDVDLIVSVCDRAHEAGAPLDRPRLHWSVADPAAGDLARFRAALDQLSERVHLLAEATSRAA